MSSENGTAPIERFLTLHGLTSYDELVERAARDPEWFWPAVMQFHGLHFFKPYERLLDVSKGPEWAEWCIGGTTNIAYNCLNRTIANGLGGKDAVLWEGEDGTRRAVSYAQLQETVARAAGGLTALGIGRGDVVGLFMPSVPETIAAFLAIVSIGAIALPMFSGFGAQAVAERLGDAGAVAVVTVDRTLRRGKAIEMAETIDALRGMTPSLRHIVVVPRDAAHPDPRWLGWAELLATGEPVAPVELPAETPAMLVYTSGTSGKAKGTVHSHCGFMTKVALDFGTILDLRPDDRLLWMSDMGWLTGPILAVASPMVGATMLLAEGVPDYPEPGRLWRLAQDYGITFLGVAPTMVRAFMQQPPGTVESYDLSTLRVTAATGEPWTPEAWNWFRDKVCGNRAPILNYSGGTEIGGGIIASTILHRDLKPCAFGGPIPGMGAVVVDLTGRPLPRGEVGELALTVPSIGLTRGLWRDPDRYLESYWSTISGLWVHGDFASVDADGNWFIHGRSDDTIKIAGKRTGPAEIEAFLLGTGKVAEAAAIGVPDPVKGSAVVCVCVLARGVSETPEVVDELRRAVVEGLGSSFRPKAVAFVGDLPKTRSMKIMRRVVRSIWIGEPVGDVSGLVNPEAVAQLRSRPGEAEVPT
ncbi:acetyl-CoA synthetase [Pseudochelatococcus lubricantis]|uniref:acetate--CoA ligase n=1 Tax=Pseudochelatococcus lubricantis TaxID=1538102 RepID=A0ABX0V1F9_9HYPH|nr:AMP-binding protein [Pseudochelatococcus lubricantis]NIJ59036.1 acetyl-CoA synthetase [Pseudochelatococcus lubricantis]